MLAGFERAFDELSGSQASVLRQIDINQRIAALQIDGRRQLADFAVHQRALAGTTQIRAHAGNRKSVVVGKSVAVLEDSGGRRTIRKKRNRKTLEKNTVGN